jgi:hypothetical protein
MSWKNGVECGLDLSGSGQGRVADACKYSCENVVYTTGGKFLDYLI